LGILNITTDSFSDGGLYLERDKALEKVQDLVAGGADIIDLGAASSNPATQEVTTQVEINRLKPLIEYLLAKDIPVSVDTFQPEVQKYALNSSVQYLNDIQGFPNMEMYPQLAASDCKLIVMHSIQRLGPATVVETKPEQVLAGIISFFKERIKSLQNAGISTERIILDPGMGFFLGSNPDSSVYVLKNITRLKDHFNLPVLVGVSRKSFLGNIVGGRAVTERGPATLAAEVYLSKMGVDYIRTHDVRALSDALKVLEMLNFKD
jgi:dihydropteroate synthase type 2/dihydropteroate synthase type 3